jgi:hypothetical protein
MYQAAMTQSPAEQTLATFLKRWRGERSVSEVAREAGFSVHSIWSKLEHGQPPSLETLILLSQYTGKGIEELAAKAGMRVQRSASDPDRAARIAAMEQAIPLTAAIIDLLGELTPAEVDTLLTIAEGLKKGRKDE